MSPPTHRWPVTQATGAEITQTNNLADRTTRGEAMKKVKKTVVEPDEDQRLNQHEIYRRDFQRARRNGQE